MRCSQAFAHASVHPYVPIQAHTDTFPMHPVTGLQPSGVQGGIGTVTVPAFLHLPYLGSDAALMRCWASAPLSTGHAFTRNLDFFTSSSYCTGCVKVVYPSLCAAVATVLLLLLPARVCTDWCGCTAACLLGDVVRGGDIIQEAAGLALQRRSWLLQLKTVRLQVCMKSNRWPLLVKCRCPS